MEIIKEEILALTKALRTEQKAYFKTRDKDILTKCKGMERQLDNLIDRADKAQTELAVNNEFEIKILLAFEKNGECVMRPSLPGQLSAKMAMDALYSSAENLQTMYNHFAKDDLHGATLKICDLFK